jgi:hypothetical protein
MSVEDDFRRVVDIMRGWGFSVREEGGCYGRSNGSGWSSGRPNGHVNHHFVCSMNSSQSYIDSLVQMLVDGDTVNWFADVNGQAYLVGTGPMNHAGTGNSSVLNLTKNDQAPPGPAYSSGDMSGNSNYSGTECQHPGDSTPWPSPMLDVMVAINAAEFIVWGYSANRAINHFEWTNRKIDMSAGGGANSGGWAGDELRRRVAAQMGGTTQPGGDEFDMASIADLEAAIWAQINRPEFLEAVAITVWTKSITDRAANDLLNAAAVNAEWAVAGINALPVNVWIKGITGDGPGQHANELLAQAAAGHGNPAAAVMDVSE